MERGEGPAQEKKVIAGELAFLLGLLMNSAAVALYVKSDVGMSTIALAAYVLSLVFPALSLGTWSYLIQCALILVLFILLGRLKPGYLLSFGLAIVYGGLIDLFRWLFASLPGSLPFRALYYMVGFSGLSFGTAFLVKCRLPVLPFDTFTRDISSRFGISYKKIRTLFDLGSLAFSAGLGFFRLGSFEGIGLGTLINALFMGIAVGAVSAALDRSFRFEPRMPELGRLSE